MLKPHYDFFVNNLLHGRENTETSVQTRQKKLLTSIRILLGQKAKK